MNCLSFCYLFYYLIEFFDNLCFFFLFVCFKWSSIITRKWTTPLITLLKSLLTFGPYLTNEGSCLFLLCCTKCLIILKSLLTLLPDVYNVTHSWQWNHLVIQTRQDHLIIIERLGTLLNACKRKTIKGEQKTSAWYQESKSSGKSVHIEVQSLEHLVLYC